MLAGLLAYPIAARSPRACTARVGQGSRDRTQRRRGGLSACPPAYDLRHAAVSTWLNSGVPAHRWPRGLGTASTSCCGSMPSASSVKRRRPSAGSKRRFAMAAHDRDRVATANHGTEPVRAGRTWTSTRAAPDRVCAGRGPLRRGGGRSRIRTWEAFATDLQSAPFGRSGNLPGCAVARYAGYDSEEPGSVGGSVGEEALPWQTHRSTW
jgi:hypothetical protein